MQIASTQSGSFVAVLRSSREKVERFSRMYGVQYVSQLTMESSGGCLYTCEAPVAPSTLSPSSLSLLSSLIILIWRLRTFAHDDGQAYFSPTFGSEFNLSSPSKIISSFLPSATRTVTFSFHVSNRDTPAPVF